MLRVIFYRKMLNLFIFSLFRFIRIVFIPLVAMAVRGNWIHLDAKRLVNRAHNCFFNSSIQVLLSYPKFVSYYYNLVLQGDVSNAFKKFLIEYEKNDYTDPEEFIKTLRKHIDILDGNEQDAHEFLISFLQKLYLEQDGSISAIDSIEKLMQVKKDNHINAIFSGMYENTIKCSAQNCLKESKKCEEFMILSLPLRHKLSQSFVDFCQPELLEGWKCDACEEVGKAYKKIEFKVFPDIFIIHLRRFTDSGNKDNKPIDIEKDIELPGASYSITGIIKHYGHLDSGHYISASIRKNKWVHFDDMTVYPLDSLELSKSQAYILFYNKTVN
ncbi:hypothetical protein EDEG_00746 [Edhazardia aedis USNM 41457]|uniref:ubiquitinyl hydrolase 1 n=1 Tax=Edhazardia aedis (strain USNM 41457) TaxID=1003232 RepID=J9DRH4_EDHAE|nr:hypothetical protein EDEG_00746 [Edhazardia aedis USNM 41457]|eukprot:EJW05165.1 hypothetical protein EDEG_00746 [Edhazardia aedis USNM 41457]